MELNLKNQTHSHTPITTQLFKYQKYVASQHKDLDVPTHKKFTSTLYNFDTKRRTREQRISANSFNLEDTSLGGNHLKNAFHTCVNLYESNEHLLYNAAAAINLNNFTYVGGLMPFFELADCLPRKLFTIASTRQNNLFHAHIAKWKEQSGDYNDVSFHTMEQILDEVDPLNDPQEELDVFFDFSEFIFNRYMEVLVIARQLGYSPTSRGICFIHENSDYENFSLHHTYVYRKAVYHSPVSMQRQDAEAISEIYRRMQSYDDASISHKARIFPECHIDSRTIDFIPEVPQIFLQQRQFIASLVTVLPPVAKPDPESIYSIKLERGAIAQADTAVIQEENLAAEINPDSTPGVQIQDLAIRIKDKMSRQMNILPHIQASPWIKDDWQRKKLLLGRFTWTKVMPRETIYKILWPNTLNRTWAGGAPPIIELIQRHARVSMKPKFTLVNNTLIQNSGMIRVWIINDSNDIAQATDLVLFNRMASGTGIEIDASDPKHVEISADQNWVNPTFNPSVTSHSGYSTQMALVIAVMAPLQIPEGAAPSVEFQIFVEMESLEMYKLRATSLIAPNITLATDTYASLIQDVKREHGAEAQIFGWLKKAVNTVVSPIKSVIDIVKDVAAPVLDIVQDPLVQAGIGAATGNPAMILPLLDSAGSTPSPTQTGINVTTAIAPPSHIATNYTDSYKDLTQIKSLVDSFTWNMQQTSTTTIYTQLIAPGFTGTKYTSAFENIIRTHESCVGDLYYHFKVVKNKFANGRLNILLLPPDDDNAAPNSYSGNHNYEHVILDISSNTEITVHVPFIGPRPFLRILQAPPATGTTSSFTFGVITVQVLNTLIAPNAGYSATVNVYSTYSPKFRLFNPLRILKEEEPQLVSNNAIFYLEELIEAKLAQKVDRGAIAQMMEQLESGQESSEDTKFQETPTLDETPGEFDEATPGAHEETTCLRQLLMRNRPIINDLITNTNYCTYYIQPYPTIGCLVGYPGPPRETIIPCQRMVDLMTMFGSWRSSFTIDIVIPMDMTDRITAIVHFDRVETPTNGTSQVVRVFETAPGIDKNQAIKREIQYEGLQGGRSHIISIGQTKGTYSFVIPYNSNDQFKKIVDTNVAHITSTEFTLPLVTISIIPEFAQHLATQDPAIPSKYYNIAMFFRCNDDLQLYGFKGAPRTIIPPPLPGSLGMDLAHDLIPVGDDYIMGSDMFAALEDANRVYGLNLNATAFCRAYTRRAQYNIKTEYARLKTQSATREIKIDRGAISQGAGNSKAPEDKIFVMRNNKFGEWISDRDTFVQKVVKDSMDVFLDYPRTKYSTFMRTYPIVEARAVWTAVEKNIGDISQMEHAYRNDVLLFLGETGFMLNTNSPLRFFHTQDDLVAFLRKVPDTFLVIPDSEYQLQLQQRRITEVTTHFPRFKSTQLVPTEQNGIFREFLSYPGVDFAHVLTVFIQSLRGVITGEQFYDWLSRRHQVKGLKVPEFLKRESVRNDFITDMRKNYPVGLREGLPMEVRILMPDYDKIDRGAEAQMFKKLKDTNNNINDAAEETAKALRSVSPDISEASKEVKTAAQKISRFGDRAHVTLDRVDNLADKTSEFVERISKQSLYEILFQKPQDFPKSDDSSAPKDKSLGSLLDSGFITRRLFELSQVFLCEGTSQALWSFIGHTLIDCGLDISLCTKIIDLIQPLFDGSPASTPRGHREAQGFEGVASSLTALTLVVGTIFYQKIPPQSQILKCTREISLRFRDIAGIGLGVKHLTETFFPKIKDAIMAAGEFFLGVQHSEIRQARKLEDKLPHISKWMEIVISVDELSATVQGTRNEEYNAFINQMSALGDIYEGAIMTHKIPPPVLQAIRENNKKLRKIRGEIFIARKDDGLRYSPFVIAMTGESGVGKSWFAQKIVSDFANAFNIAAFNRIYCRGASKHWDLYHDQWACYTDDFGQNVDDEEYTEFIQMCSNNPWILPMASIAAKGTSFRSHFVLQSTNDAYPNPTTIKHRPAVLRRRNMLVRLDSVLPDRQADLSHIRFHILDPLEPGQVRHEGEALIFTYAQFCEYAYQNFLAWMEDQYEGYKAQDLAETLIRYPHTEYSPEGAKVAALETEKLHERFQRLDPEIILKNTPPSRVPPQFRDFYESLNRTKTQRSRFRDRWALKFAKTKYAHKLIRKAGAQMESPHDAEDSEYGDSDSSFDIIARNFTPEEMLMDCLCGDRHNADEVEECCSSTGQAITAPPPALPPTDEAKFFEWVENNKAFTHKINPVKSANFFVSTNGSRFDTKFIPTLRAYYGAKNDEERNAAVTAGIVFSPYFEIYLEDFKELSENEKQVYLAIGSKKGFNMAHFKHQLETSAKGIIEKAKELLVKLWTEHKGLLALGVAAVVVASYFAIRRLTDVMSLVSKVKQVKKSSAQTVSATYDRAQIRRTYRLAGMKRAGGAAQCEGCDQLAAFHAVQISNLPKEKKDKKLAAMLEESQIDDSCEYCEDWNAGLPNLISDLDKEPSILERMITYAKHSILGRLYLWIGRGKKIDIDAEAQSDNCISDDLLESLDIEVKKSIEKARCGQCETCLAKKELGSEAQSKIDKNALAISESISSNLWNISNVSRPPMMLNCYVVGKDIVQIPRHFLDACEDDDILELVGHKGMKILTRYDKKRWLDADMEQVDQKRYGYIDQGLYRMCGNFCPQKDISNHIFKENDLVYIPGSPAELLTRNKHGELKVTTIPSLEMYYKGESYTRWLDAQKTKGIKYQTVLGVGYKGVTTTAGMCGGMVILHNPKSPRKLVGFHVSSLDDSYGGANVVFQDDIVPFFKQSQASFGVPVPSGMDMNAIYEKGIVKPEIGSTIEPIGLAPKNLIVRIPTKTDLLPSKIHGVFPPTSAPSVMTPTDFRFDAKNNPTPLQQAIKGWGQRILPMKYSRFEKIMEYKFWRNEQLTKPNRRRLVLSWDEAINGGYEVSPIAKGLDMTTSPGLPWVKDRPVGEHGKAFLFINRGTAEEPDYEMNEQLKRSVLRREEQAKKGFRVKSYWMDMLKGERRPLEKITSGKTRNFVIGPVDHTILFRKYFYDFLMNMQENCVAHPNKVGINPMGVDWTQWTRRRMAKGEQVVAGDYSKFDRTLQGEFGRQFAILANKWYDDGEENAQVRFILMEEACHRLTVCGNVLYIVNQGNPSGFGGTTPFNGDANETYQINSWLDIWEAFAEGDYSIIESCSHQAQNMWDNAICAFEPMDTIEDYDNNVELASYGDDINMAVTKEAAMVFNFETVRANLAKYNIEFTPEDKGTEFSTTKDIYDATFLKRTTKPHPKFSQFYLAPMEVGVIQEECNWIRDCDDHDSATRDIVGASLREAYAHGRRFFDEHKKTLNAALCQANLKPVHLTYEELNNTWIGQFGVEDFATKHQQSTRAMERETKRDIFLLKSAGQPSAPDSGYESNFAQEPIFHG